MLHEGLSKGRRPKLQAEHIFLNGSVIQICFFVLMSRFSLKSIYFLFYLFFTQGEYIRETGINRQKLRDRVKIYRQHIRQPKYQMLKVEEHLRNCGISQFKIFPFLKMRSKDTELRRAFEERFQLKFKTRLNKL